MAFMPCMPCMPCMPWVLACVLCHVCGQNTNIKRATCSLKRASCWHKLQCRGSHIRRPRQDTTRVELSPRTLESLRSSPCPSTSVSVLATRPCKMTPNPSKSVSRSGDSKDKSGDGEFSKTNFNAAPPGLDIAVPLALMLRTLSPSSPSIWLLPSRSSSASTRTMPPLLADS